MEHQKIINLLDNTSNQPSRFRTKNWAEITDARNNRYNKKNLKFKTTVLHASLCDAYILVEGRITIVGQAANDAAIAADSNNKEFVF